MRGVHGVEAVRAAESELLARLPDGALMQRAAAGLARRCAELLGRVYGADVVLLVGSGNNGGDALYAGARLAGRGAQVTALVTGSAPHPGGLAGLRGAGGRVLDVSQDGSGGGSDGHSSSPAGGAGAVRAVLAGADLVVDGLVGIGGRGPLREPARGLARLLAGCAATVVAVDVPSGVDADTGEVGGAPPEDGATARGEVDGVAVRADVTVTFGTLKPGLVVSPGAGFAGLVEVVDIGLGPALPAPGTATLAMLDAADVAALLPTPAGESSKYTRGVAGVVAGSRTYTGAAVLACGGALVAGAGMVRFAGVAHAGELVRHRWPEVVVTDVPASDAGTVADPQAVLDAGRVQAWVVGSGLGTDEHAAAVVEAVLGADVPVLVDADGLTVLAGHREWLTRRTAPTLLTPHAGEFARLMGAERDDVEGRRLSWARRAADELGVTVLLKGLTTVVADPDGRARVNGTATSWLATAGSGDVLSGGCGSLLAQGLTALDAGSVGAFLHGMAGTFASRGPSRRGAGAPVSALDLLTCWADVERTVRQSGRAEVP